MSDLDLVRHNHLTRDVKPPGACPACDRYRTDAVEPPPGGEDRTAVEYLTWSVRHWRGRTRIAEAEVRRLREDLSKSHFVMGTHAMRAIGVEPPADA